MAQINLYLIQFGTGLALLSAAIEFFKQGRLALRSPQFYLGLVVALIQLRLGLLLAGMLPLDGPWFFLFFAGTFAFGPVSMVLIRGMAAFALPLGDSRWKIHFVLPPLAALVEIALYLYGPGDEFYARGPGWQGVDWFFVATGLYLSAIAVYFFILFYRILSQYEVGHVPLYLALIGAPGLGQLLVHLGYFLDADWLIHLGADCLTVFMVLLFLFPARYPKFLETLKKELESQRYERTRISGLDVDDVMRQLESLMTEGRFRDEDLRLAVLAGELELSTNQLSRILNERYQKNFNEFVNGYRIDEARALLKGDPERTILSIAYEVGFRSKSAFNAQFVRLEGRTPLEYRRDAASK